MASRLPAFPRFVFTIFEPISLIAGSVPAMLNPEWFVNEQITTSGAYRAPSDSGLLVAQQLGNAYGLLFMLGVAVLYTTTEIKVVRNYLVALWIADISHVWVTYNALGRERFLSLGQWNAMTWGNVGVTAFLCLTRTAYLLGLFGPDKALSLVPARKAD